MLIGTILALMVSTALVSFILSYLTLRPRRRRKTKSPADYGLPFEDVKFESEGVPMAGWFVRSTRPGAATLVLVHGWESSAQGMLQHADYLRDLDVNFMFYDARSHGDSGPSNYMSLVRMSQDLEAALGYLRTRGDIDMFKILLFGHSMGAATAITVAARHAYIMGVVASSSFADFELLTRDMLKPFRLPYWPIGALMMLFWKLRLQINIGEWNPSHNLTRIAAPVFVAHGTSDEMISQKHFEILRLSHKIDHLLIPDGKHRNLHEFQAYRESIIQFIRRSLSGKDAAAA